MAVTLLSTTTLSAVAANITISSIPQTAKDLMVIISGRCTTSANSITAQINGNTTGVTRRALRGNGATVTVVSGTTAVLAGLLTESGSSTGAFADSTLYFYNYASSSLEKWCYVDSGQENASASTNTNNYLYTLYKSVADPITSIIFAATTGNLEVGTMLSIYTIS